MKALLLCFLIAWSSASADEVFRVSRVVDAAGEGIERMTFKAGEHEEVLFVKKEAVVSAADVQEAWAEMPEMKPPEENWEPYTEEEYQQIKASREMMGFFHLDKIPSEEELSASLRKGMSVDEVVKAFGRPYLPSREVGPEVSRLKFLIAPERREESPDGMAVEDGFDVDLRDGKVTGWSYSYSNFPKELKLVGREAPSLKMTAPEIEGPIEEFDFIDYFEKMDVENPRQEVNRRDLSDLLALCSMLGSWSGQKEAEEGLVRADCDLMETMATHFPEIAALRKEAKEGRILVSALSEAVAPYLTDRKPLPLADPKGE